MLNTGNIVSDCVQEGTNLLDFKALFCLVYDAIKVGCTRGPM